MPVLQLVVLSAAAVYHVSLLFMYAVVALGAVLAALVPPVTSALVLQLVATPEELSMAHPAWIVYEQTAAG
jgi:hypothetical protein